jgi:hypothetical protein
MLKSIIIKVVSHFKYQNNLVHLYTFNAVIINITKFPFGCFAKTPEVKGFQVIGSLFFIPKIHFINK